MQLTHSLQKPGPGSGQLTVLLRWSKYFAIFILSVGILVLTGWAWNIDLFKRPILHLTAIPPFPSPFAAKRSIIAKRNIVGKILAALVLLIGLLRLAGPLPGLQLSVDQLFFTHRLLTDPYNDCLIKSITYAPLPHRR
jgi:hypothetical protein